MSTENPTVALPTSAETRTLSSELGTPPPPSAASSPSSFSDTSGPSAFSVLSKETQLDTQISRQVWEGALPLVFRLRRAEVCALQSPHAVYVMASRGTYLPLLMAEFRQHFAQAVSPENRDQEMWVEAEGVPLRWHLPLGVLYDQLCGGTSPIGSATVSASTSAASSGSTDTMASSSLDIPPAGATLLSGHLPWELTVRFAGFPSSRILHCPSLRTVEQHFMNVLKQANYIKFGNGSGVNSLTSSQQIQLWQAVSKGDFDSYLEVNDRLWPSQVKHLPIRVLRRNSLPTVQLPFEPYRVDGQENTVAGALHLVDSALFPDPCACGSDWNVLVHGIAIPLETPLLWLCRNLSYPDNFVYIVLCHQ
eukprot:CAMPEP_0177661708 /NCGR_PEP_ID=MMETSP0447-20121125/18853_1 /TAXON_ID=0 /ORGANISM="Stygamoeba regulata, Strain BSH-02190019" /LENGTH=363 /DNA_ID=CAMNT_0019167129 /DNA_START=31 /DNA_END=1122 /DNA_ORIENTATION=+